MELSPRPNFPPVLRPRPPPLTSPHHHQNKAELATKIAMGLGHKKKLKSLIAAQSAIPAAPAAPVEDKFFAKQLVMGQAAEAAHGLAAALGLTDAELGAQLQRGEQAIVDEFTAHGSAEDKANLQYVLRGTALKEEDLPAHVQQQMREHKCVATSNCGPACPDALPPPPDDDPEPCPPAR